MNVVDFFWYYGPTGIWFLGGSVFFSAIVWLVNTQRIIGELKKTTVELRRGASQLEHITTELRQDTRSLQTGTNELKTELGLTRISVDRMGKTLRQVYSWTDWFTAPK